MNTSQQITSLLEKRILLLDGAMGTMIQRQKLSESDYRGGRFASINYDIAGNDDILCLTKPLLIKEIHLEYLRAGADIIETNSFNATRSSQSDYKLEDLAYEINKAAAASVSGFYFSHPKSSYFQQGKFLGSRWTILL